ncbi:hypothetical protein V6N13_077133 [Hibiscus sabdariffa]
MLVQDEANAVKRWGFGAVLRDANGSFIAARSWKQAGHVDTLLKEANAILPGIKWLLEMQVIGYTLIMSLLIGLTKMGATLCSTGHDMNNGIGCGSDSSYS